MSHHFTFEEKLFVRITASSANGVVPVQARLVWPARLFMGLLKNAIALRES